MQNEASESLLGPIAFLRLQLFSLGIISNSTTSHYIQTTLTQQHKAFSEAHHHLEVPLPKRRKANSILAQTNLSSYPLAPRVRLEPDFQIYYSPQVHTECCSSVTHNFFHYITHSKALRRFNGKKNNSGRASVVVLPIRFWVKKSFSLGNLLFPPRMSLQTLSILRDPFTKIEVAVEASNARLDASKKEYRSMKCISKCINVYHQTEEQSHA
jgi:hypothetical protein